MWQKLKNFFISLFAKPLIEEGGEALEKELRKMAVAKPKLFKVLVVSSYAAAKEYGPALVASTATDLDDKALEEFLEAIQTVAEEFNIDFNYEAAKIEDAEEEGGPDGQS